MLNRFGDPSIIDCTFRNNEVDSNGGGMWNDGASPTVIRSRFIMNSSVLDGGGMGNQASTPTLLDVVFQDNRAFRGAGMYNYESSSTLRRCVFTDNVAIPDWVYGQGGAVYSEGMSEFIAINCSFIGNKAKYLGGAILASNSRSTLTSCRLLDNYAAYGGAINVGEGSFTLANCILSGNTAHQRGGALRNDSSSTLTMQNCTLWGNVARSGGGAIWEDSATSMLSNCIVWENGAEPIVASPGTSVSYSNVQGGWPGDGENNIEADPLLLDPEGPDGVLGTNDDDFRLLSGSPCIDAGDNTAVPADTPDLDGDGDTDEPLPLDINGSDRFIDYPATPDSGNSDGSLPVVDMGASEFTGSWMVVDDDNCPGPGTGTWYDPFCSIQDAIDAVTDGQTVFVATGTYYETVSFKGKAITLRSIEGAGETTIDGMGLDTVVECVHDEGPDTVLQGFTITGGHADLGGGMFNRSDSSPTVRSCVFHRNTASESGGGMYNRGGAPTIIDCTFSENAATISGGGMYNWHGSPTIIDCTFSENAATIGGGIYNQHGSPAIINCTFHENDATAADGAGMFNEGASPEIVGCTFSGNSAMHGGGGIYSRHGTPAISDCTFHANNATDKGGGMANNNSSPIITNCIFTGNTAGDQGGGVYSEFKNELSATNCLFINNGAAVGGAIFNQGDEDCSSTLTNCTLFGNVASSNAGGVSGGLLTLNNCILWDNVPDQIANPEVGSTVSYCALQGGWSGDGANNIDADPLLTDPDGADGVLGTEDDDLRPQAGSPVIDAGSNDVDIDTATPGAQPLPDVDIAGNDRIIDGDHDEEEPGVWATVDMGAYEFPEWDGDGDFDNGETVVLNPGGGSGDPTEDALVEITNDSGPDDAIVTVSQANYTPHPHDASYGALGTTLTIETNLADGEFFMTVSIPFAQADLSGADPLSIEMVYYNTSTGEWELAVSGNVQESPGYEPSPIGDRFAVQGSTLPTLSNDLGDYGVYWNPNTQTGFVWANVDHATDFGPAFPTDLEADCNNNGVPDGRDIDEGTSLDCQPNDIPDECDIAAGTTLDCNANQVPDECETIEGGDFDDDGNISLDDFSALVACFAGPGSALNPIASECASACLSAFDLDTDLDVDLRDFVGFQIAFTGGARSEIR
jgi:predicted outer membrane repeat protein